MGGGAGQRDAEWQRVNTKLCGWLGSSGGPDGALLALQESLYFSGTPSLKPSPTAQKSSTRTRFGLVTRHHDVL